MGIGSRRVRRNTDGRSRLEPQCGRGRQPRALSPRGAVMTPASATFGRASGRNCFDETGRGRYLPNGVVGRVLDAQVSCATAWATVTDLGVTGAGAARMGCLKPRSRALSTAAPVGRAAQPARSAHARA